MLSLPPSVRIFVATQPVDGRKGVDSPMAIVRSVLSQDPLNGPAGCAMRPRPSWTMCCPMYPCGSALTAQSRIFVEEVARWQKRDGGETGSVTFVQRLNATLGAFVHLHIVVLDGRMGGSRTGFVGLARTERPTSCSSPCSTDLRADTASSFRAHATQPHRFAAPHHRRRGLRVLASRGAAPMRSAAAGEH